MGSTTLFNPVFIRPEQVVRFLLCSRDLFLSKIVIFKCRSLLILYHVGYLDKSTTVKTKWKPSFTVPPDRSNSHSIFPTTIKTSLKLLSYLSLWYAAKGRGGGVVPLTTHNVGRLFQVSYPKEFTCQRVKYLYEIPVLTFAILSTLTCRHEFTPCYTLLNLVLFCLLFSPYSWDLVSRLHCLNLVSRLCLSQVLNQQVVQQKICIFLLKLNVPNHISTFLVIVLTKHIHCVNNNPIQSVEHSTEERVLNDSIKQERHLKRARKNYCYQYQTYH